MNATAQVEVPQLQLVQAREWTSPGLWHGREFQAKSESKALSSSIGYSCCQRHDYSTDLTEAVKQIPYSSFNMLLNIPD